MHRVFFFFFFLVFFFWFFFGGGKNMWEVGHVRVTALSNKQSDKRWTPGPISISWLSLFGIWIYTIKIRGSPGGLIFIMEPVIPADWKKERKACQTNDFSTTVTQETVHMTTSGMSSEEKEWQPFWFFSPHISKCVCVPGVLIMNTSCLHNRTGAVWIL